jgi:CheY-like chemotaxis protein
MNLLFVEDDKAIQRLLSIFLESWGIDFDIASNGKEAVELAQSNEGKYDLCLMDTDMPEMNGFEAIKIIRKNVRYFPILSTSGDFTYKNKLLEIGADEFISKPYNHGELHHKIIEWSDIKTFLVRLQKNTIETRKEMPMDANHAKELKELAKRNLCKMTLKGQNVTFIVHKNVPNKIAHDFIDKGLEMSTFLDRNNDLPGECHLYKSSGLIPIIHFEEDIYQKKETREDEEMKKYHELVFKKEE